MYKEIALDPKCLQNYEYYALIKRETGFEKGRYLIADAKAWAAEAFPYVKESKIPTIKKTSIKNFLNKLRKNKSCEYIVYPGDREILKEPDWKKWWMGQNSIREFSATVCDQKLGDSITYQNIVDGSSSWELSPSKLVRRDSVDIINILEPLLLMSKELLFVDQYFSFSSNKTLVEFLNRLPKCPGLVKIHLVTSINTHNPGNVYKKEYERLLPPGVSFRLTELPVKHIHDRYMITDVGALKAGIGFSSSSSLGVPSDILSVNLVSLIEVKFICDSIDTAISNGIASTVFSI
jgi:hypothetical protein